ncbi:MAG: DUF5398 family protein [Parachlamydiales bacterium]
MFGLEKRKEMGEEAFALEKELSDSEKRAKMRKKIEERIQKLKNLLRSGGQQEEFDQYGILLHGYAALQKLIQREAA